jgi:hypothetical protein
MPPDMATDVQVKNRENVKISPVQLSSPTVQSNCPVQLPSPTVQSNCLVQLSSWSNCPVQLPSPTVQSNCPVQLSSPTVQSNCPVHVLYYAEISRSLQQKTTVQYFLPFQY